MHCALVLYCVYINPSESGYGFVKFDNDTGWFTYNKGFPFIKEKRKSYIKVRKINAFAIIYAEQQIWHYV